MTDSEIEKEFKKIMLEDHIIHNFYRKCRGDEIKALKLTVIYYSKKAKKEFEAELHKMRISPLPFDRLGEE